VVRIALEEVWAALRSIGILGVLAILEVYARVLGGWDYRVRKKKHVVWDMAWTTKNPGEEIDHREASAKTH